jgi:hypothetical protein
MTEVFMEGRRNIAWGFLFLAVFMATGFFLGYMHDLAPDKEQWIAQYAAGTHFEIRLAHVHGALFGLINVAAGCLLTKFRVPAGHARAISWLALAGLLMPVGIVAHALVGVPPVLVLGGGAAMVIATLWMSWVAFSGALTAA